MSRFVPRWMTRFAKNEDGVTAVECALILALVVVICLVALAPMSPSSDGPVQPTVSLEVENG